MKNIYIVMGCLILFSACTKHKEEKKTTIIKNENIVAKNVVSKKPVGVNNCLSDPIETLITEYNGISFYTENTLRGKGVVKISIDQKLEFLNLDKTLFGSISLIHDRGRYEIKFPKTVIAREVLPDSEFQVFSFDAELPETNNDFIVIYINKEKKLLKKEGLDYGFVAWEDYIKSSFINLTENTDNASKEERLYWYNVLEIVNRQQKVD